MNSTAATATQPPVLYSTEGTTAIVTLNRPDKVNAMNGELYDALQTYLEQFEADPDLRCLVITGAGGNFSAGGDLRWFQEMHERYDTPEREWDYDFPAYKVMERLTKPIICAIDGYCLASAFNLAVLYSDIRIASDRAKLGIPGPRRGLGIGPYPMPWNEYTGVGNIMYLTLTGLHISGADAQRMGFVSEVVAQEDLLPRALELAALIAEGSPDEIAGFKEFWREYPKLPGGSYSVLAQAIRSRIDAQRTTERGEGRRAFIEKRAPQWNA